MAHVKCRNCLYPFSNISRLIVADNQVSWSLSWEDYTPPVYNSDVLKNKPWADNSIDDNFNPKWNTLDDNVNRKSYTGEYQISQGYPLNPGGRTGIRGRGVLGRWGPNHAADPIVTRWKRINGLKQHNPTSNLPILEVCVIQRRDNNEWALPGGMVDPGEKVSVTLKREFMEEALNSLERDPKQKSEDEAMVTNFFSSGDEIYSGYVDDPRNTDNAWIETVAMNFHDDNGTAVGKFSLQAGDDAKNVKWLNINKDVQLYASHSMMIEKVVQLRQAHWCRNRYYPWSDISRLLVADNQVPWNVPWKDYNPPEYNSDDLENKPWADNRIDDKFKPKWNTIDGKVNRKSYIIDYQIVHGYPLNPEGRTGMRGRGVLGRWGPNHAADPIVTRWKRTKGIKQRHPASNLPILEVCVIQRRDNNAWAFPGGMVDPGEKVSVTLKREFMEEAMNILEREPKQKMEDSAIASFFSVYFAYSIYRGYVDDPRNTDNAWIETAAVNFHDEIGTTVNKFALQAGDDAKNVKWLQVKRNMEININHLKILKKVVAVRRAHW